MVSSIGRGEATQGKPGVTSIACATGHCTGKTERGLSTQPAAILRFVCRPTQTCSESWPWPQNKWVSRTHCGTMTSECCTETLNDFYCVFVTLSAVYFSCMYSRCDMSTWIFMRIYGYMDMEHFYVNFGDPSSTGFWDIVRTNKHTNATAHPTPRLPSACVIIIIIIINIIIIIDIIIDFVQLRSQNH